MKLSKTQRLNVEFLKKYIEENKNDEYRVSDATSILNQIKWQRTKTK